MAVPSTDKKSPADQLWSHPDPTSTPMWRFLKHVNKKHGLGLDGYPTLYQWSIDNVALFWEEVWHFVGIKASKSFDQVRQFFRDCLYHTPIFNGNIGRKCIWG